MKAVIIFPATDWVLKEGCYPTLRIFADRGEEPAPLERWLVEQTEGRFGIAVEAPAFYTFPETAEGYYRCAAKTVVVANTGKEATGELTVTFTEQKKDGAAKPAGNLDPDGYRRLDVPAGRRYLRKESLGVIGRQVVPV